MQNQSLSAAKLKTELYACFNEFSGLILEPLLIRPDNFYKRANLNWSLASVKKDWTLDNDSFIKIVSQMPKFMSFKRFSIEEKEEFADCFKTFLTKILYYLTKYLPLRNDLISTADFLEFSSTDMSLVEKIRYFENIFFLFFGYLKKNYFSLWRIPKMRMDRGNKGHYIVR